MIKEYLLIVISILFIIQIKAQSFPSTVGYKVANITSYTKVATSNQTTLYNIQLNSTYDPVIQLIEVRGSTRYQMGFDYATLLGKDIIQIATSLFNSLLSDKIELDALYFFLDWQWNWFLSRDVPKEYLEEISGIKASSDIQKIGEIDKFVTRIIVVANFPGTLSDLKYVLENELGGKEEMIFASIQSTLNKKQRKEIMEFIKTEKFRTMIENVSRKWKSQCSNWAAWGSRTVNGEIFSFRNLDWTKDTGMSQRKLISVFHPPGKIPHVTFGWAGMLGAITGISKMGITAHEANLEEKPETFKGFPFVLRLRYIMENANNLEEVISLWNSTRNTVGFIHMFSSASNRMAVAIETMANYDAYFFDNDEREKTAILYNNQTGVTTQLGFPLEDAVYRSNNGFDPEIRKNYLWNQNFTTDPEGTEDRYYTQYLSTKYYSDNNIKIDIPQVINITAIIAQKGKNVYQCQNANNGSNVLSVSYMPERLFAYAAWENGSGNNWRPACCNTYVGIDLNPWFNSKK